MRDPNTTYTTPEPSPEDLKKEVHGMKNWIKRYMNKYPADPHIRGELTYLLKTGERNTLSLISGQGVKGEINNE